MGKVLSGGLILCDTTLPLGTGLSESKLPLSTISKLPLDTRLKKSVLLLGLSLGTGLSESKLPLGTISKLLLGTRLNGSVLLLGLPLDTVLNESKLSLGTIFLLGMELYDSKLPLGTGLYEIAIGHDIAIGHGMI